MNWDALESAVWDLVGPMAHFLARDLEWLVVHGYADVPMRVRHPSITNVATPTERYACSDLLLYNRPHIESARPQLVTSFDIVLPSDPRPALPSYPGAPLHVSQAARAKCVSPSETLPCLARVRPATEVEYAYARMAYKPGVPWNDIYAPRERGPSICPGCGWCWERTSK